MSMRPTAAGRAPASMLRQPASSSSVNSLHSGHAAKYAQMAIPSEDLVFIHFLNEGQFGEVWEGLWMSPMGDTRVALKTIKPREGDPSVQTSLLDDFMREAGIMQKLNHPNILKLYGVALDGRDPAIVLEFMAEGSLSDYVKGRLGVSTALLVNLAAQICSGMEYLALHGIVHRDLAARNILVDDGPIAKVCDFGFSRILDDTYYVTSTRDRIPLRWTPPEAILYKKYSTASDVWSFGVLLWELTDRCRALPYAHMSAGDVIDAVEAGYRLPAPADCPPQVYGIMQRCWAAEPRDRPSFSEIGNALRQYMAALSRPLR